MTNVGKSKFFLKNFIQNWIINRHIYVYYIFLKCLLEFDKTFLSWSSEGSHKIEELKHEVRWFFFCWQLQTRYHIFGLCQRCGRSWLEEEERTEAALEFLSTRHLRRNSVTHLKPSK